MVRKRRQSGDAAWQPGSLARPHCALMFTGCLVNEGETHTFVSLLLGTQRGAAVFDYRTLRSWKGVCLDFNLCVAPAFCSLLNDPSLRNRREFRSLVQWLNLIVSSLVHLLLVIFCAVTAYRYLLQDTNQENNLAHLTFSKHQQISRKGAQVALCLQPTGQGAVTNLGGASVPLTS